MEKANLAKIRHVSRNPCDKAMAKIFISYRRDDTGKTAWRLFDWLERQFGAANVFCDREVIGTGDIFPQVLEHRLAESEFLVVVIGPRWLTIADDQGRPRLWAEGDYVAYEVSFALSHRKRVIPVLVDGARMPAREELPPALSGLAENQALSIDDAYFRNDFEELVDTITGRPRGYIEREGDRAHPLRRLARYLKHLKHVLAGRDIDETDIFSTPASNETVNFTAYYSRTSVPASKYSFIVYAYLPKLRNDVNLDAEKFSTELGGSIPTPRRSRENVKLKRNTLIRVVPECDKVKFDPPELTKRWDGSWTRFLFDFVLGRELVSEVVLVRVSIQVAGIEIACISNCAIEVIESQRCDGDKSLLADADSGNQTSALYQRIFVSYSRRDREITERYKLAQIALGNEAFIDVDDLRTGENWRDALARAIDVADVFQLFWSANSANSEYCRYEWNYALEFRCPDSKREGFIRPVYWQKPMPDPPPELSHISFKYVPFADNIK